VGRSSLSKASLVAIVPEVRGRTEIDGELMTVLVIVTTAACGVPVDILKKLVWGNLPDLPDGDNGVCNVAMFGLEIQSSIDQRTGNCNMDKIAGQMGVDPN